MILVTGGAGYIGSHTIVELLNNNYDVIVLDNLINSSKTSLDRVKEICKKDFSFVKGDLRDKHLLRSIFESNKIDAVIHFAGLKAVGESAINPISYYENNLNGLVLLIKEMNNFACKKIVFSSSATVYGNPLSLPLRESETYYNPTNPYGNSKYFIEKILKDLYVSDDQWSIINLRYFNPVGAHKSGLIGENPRGVPNNLMPYITQTAAGILNKVLIYGDDYNTHDGTGVRDYIHVSDLAIAHLKALNKVLNESFYEVVNLGTGKGYSVLDIINTFSNVTGITIPYEIVPRRPGDVASLYSDITFAKDFINWQPEKGLDEMCSDSWNWQKNNPNGYD